jgi:hypothetical protein
MLFINLDKVFAGFSFFYFSFSSHIFDFFDLIKVKFVLNSVTNNVLYKLDFLF